MKIINFVDNLESVNFGIWNAAVSTAEELSQQGVHSEIWFPQIERIPDIKAVKLVALTNLSVSAVADKIIQGYDKCETVIVSHGCWMYPTKIGYALHNKGYKWIAVPHGMLEPWSMQQKKFKKLIYLYLIEKRMLHQADAIRAVGTPELYNLRRTYSSNNLHLIPNGTEETVKIEKDWEKPLRFLFMARLHHKKGIVPLVEAWASSLLHNNAGYKLIIAGPDDGEKENMHKAILRNGSTNLEYVGPRYGREKEELLKNTHFYILPSYSEGFPTSVLEGMQNGLVPIITEGCNFPEAFENEMAIKISPAIEDIVSGLNQVALYNEAELNLVSQKVQEFVCANYSLKHIAEMQNKFYQKLLNM